VVVEDGYSICLTDAAPSVAQYRNRMPVALEDCKHPPMEPPSATRLMSRPFKDACSALGCVRPHYALIGERHVTCDPRSVDRYGRTVAVCHVDGRDLGADMVADGHAWAFVRYSRDYVDEEHEAASVRAGIHGHTCQPAWRWRAERR
jgi:hypothetical protein